MNILSISNCKLTKTQGSGNVILNYTNGLRAKGHSIKVYSPESYPSLNILMGRAYIYRFAVLSFSTIIKELYIQRNKYDIIEFYGEENWLSILFLSFFNKKQVFVHHSNGPSTIVNYVRHKNFKIYERFLYFLKKASITKSKKIVLVSRYCYNHVINELKVKKDKVHYINNGIESDYLGLDIDYDEKQNLILFIGSFIPIKGKLEFIQTLNSVFSENLEWRAEIIGDNNPKDLILFEKRIRHRIKFIKTVNCKSELSAIYRKAKILFMPSTVETFGLAFCEAMAHKCIVVSRNVGFLMECNSEEVVKCTDDFHIKLRAVLLSKINIHDIAENAYKKVQNLNWATAIDKYETFLKGITWKN